MTLAKWTGYTSPSANLRDDIEVDPNAVTQSITAAAAVAWNVHRVEVVGPAASTYAITLAAPVDDRFGTHLSIKMLSTTATNSVTLALTNVVGGTAATTATFTVAGHELVLLAVHGRWVVLAEVGVVLS